MKTVAWFEEITKDDVSLVGGKGANLGEMTRAGFPIPPGFVVTADAYFYFVEQTGIKDKIQEKLKNLNVDDTDQLEKVTKEIRDLIVNTPMLPEIAVAIKDAYAKLSEKVGKDPNKDPPWVAVRSSATAEDLPDASFAGQQDTYIYVRGYDDVLTHVKKCWASLFTARATYYRAKQGFDHMKVGLAAVVQKMVNSEVSGIMFTAHPVTGEPKIIIEAGWGQGEALVSGMVTPDEYIVDKNSFQIVSKKISEQKIMITMKPGGGDQQVPVPAHLRKVQKLPDDKIIALAKIGAQIEKHYGHPQDIEWAMEGGKLYVVQARNITTIGKFKQAEESAQSEEDAEPILKGLAASPGVATGPVKIIHDISELDKVQKGDILVTTMTTPDMVPAMRRAAAIVTDEGGMTCHAAIVSRELGIPAVVGTGKATKVLKDGQIVTVDATRGVVYEGRVKTGESSKPVEVIRSGSAPLITATLVKVNVAMPAAAERAAKTGADGVGLLRAEHMITATGKHPAWFIENNKTDELVEAVKKGIRTVAEKFYPKPVWYRTFDARTDEFRNLKGGEKEPEEDNPMIGWHGIRRALDQPALIQAEFRAIKELHDEGLDNVGVMLPFVIRPDEVVAAERLAREVGLRPHKDVDFGIMVETPAAAVRIEDFVDLGIDFLSFGTNDLTQLTLGIDRNNAHVQKLFSEMHPAVLDLISYVISVAKDAGVETSICGQAGSYPPMVRKLVRMGIDSISANIDAVPKIRETVYREERRMMLEAARKSLFEK
ncbi:MAG: phosphoenolpyruvate synthase [Candidatus Diapherotrites archaeon]|nr:phosphoenolpyruvate synthase [Candidatus Diapherotrites archaeon]